LFPLFYPGEVKDGKLECLYHGWKFDKTGLFQYDFIELEIYFDLLSFEILLQDVLYFILFRVQNKIWQPTLLEDTHIADLLTLAVLKLYL
jgi:hypothetical protein